MFNMIVMIYESPQAYHNGDAPRFTHETARHYPAVKNHVGLLNLVDAIEKDGTFYVEVRECMRGNK